MKLTRTIIAAIIITLCAFGAVVHTSCTKDQCAKITCQHGGYCSKGFCYCPYGYSGDFCEVAATSTIQYFNNSYTEMTLTLNNVAYKIPARHSKGFTGHYGDTLQGNAFTRGPYGKEIDWDSIMNIFPIHGSLDVPLDVPANYFYLVVLNDSSSSLLREFRINTGSLLEEDVIIVSPAPFVAYQQTAGVGYFHADSATSNVYIKSSTNWGFNFPAPLPGITSNKNQQINLVTH